MIAECSRKLVSPIALSVLVLSLACQSATAPAEPTTVETPRDGLFLHVSQGADNPHRVLMALRLAEIMSADKDVLVYFDVTGVQAVLKDQEPIEAEGFESSVVLLDKLIQSGAIVCVCPTCLAKAGKSLADVMEGVQLAEKDRFFDFTEGRILTLDY
jgi:predicted peroxiredoxin